MNFASKYVALCAVMLYGLCSCPVYAQRQMEKLDRGVVAIHKDDNSVFVSWRMLGTDPDVIAFDVLRTIAGGQPVKLNAQPIKDVTFLVDKDVKFDQAITYSVHPAPYAASKTISGSFTLPANSTAKPYLSIPLRTPEGYTPGDASVGDLDGDGQYDIVLHQTNNPQDNSHSGITGPPILEAYKLDGTMLWRINLGKNIREGAHYTQFMVYDLDGDGRAEVVCKTADGTVDGVGQVIGDPNANYVNPAGKIVSGPEYLTVFDGKTGKALATTNYIPARYPDKLDPTPDEMKAYWGDGYGNRCDRFLACVAYLDGVHPSVVMCRGYYTRTFLVAWDFRDGKLKHRWTFDSGDGTPGNEKYAGQGNHNLSVTDVDGDGKDEIIYGGMVINPDGKGRFSTGLGHGDAIHVGDFNPYNPGIEVYRIQERFDDAGTHMYDARTGKIIWKHASVKAADSGGDKGEGPARGACFDIDPTHPGAESWALGAGMHGIYDCQGKFLYEGKIPCNMGIWWDGDDLREMLDGVNITKWNWNTKVCDPVFDARQYNCVKINGTKSNPCLSADILGDWREELICATEDAKELRIFTTTIPTDHRFYTFMHDPQYRLSIAWQNVAYNQPPHTSFFVGQNMKAPPKPKIVLVEPKTSK